MEEVKDDVDKEKVVLSLKEALMAQVEPETKEIWSSKEKRVITWDVTLESDKTPTEQGDIDHITIVAKVGDEEYRFSPNTTEEELKQRIIDINKEQK